MKQQEQDGAHQLPLSAEPVPSINFENHLDMILDKKKPRFLKKKCTSGALVHLPPRFRVEKQAVRSRADIINGSAQLETK